MKRYLAEFLGTFAMVFCACGAIIADQHLDAGIGGIGVSLVFGLVIMVMIFAVGSVSGAHFNPAVTLGFLATGEFEKKEVAPYLIAQFAAAIVASGLHLLIFPGTPTFGETLPTIGIANSFVLELICTFFLMLVILMSISDERSKPFAAIAIGGTVGLEALFAGPMTGASMNPARTLGPAIASGNFEGIWLYMAAPVTGALLAVVAYKIMRK
jgi:aquaporin NIP